jgi:hypothetical protein
MAAANGAGIGGGGAASGGSGSGLSADAAYGSGTSSGSGHTPTLGGVPSPSLAWAEMQASYAQPQHPAAMPPPLGPLGAPQPNGAATLRRLPGDGSSAVAAMADYLAGLAPAPPLHMLQETAVPSAAGRPLDLRALFSAVVERGGYCAVTSAGRWPEVLRLLGLLARGDAEDAVFAAVHSAYLKLLLRFERMYNTEEWLLLTGHPVSRLDA